MLLVYLIFATICVFIICLYLKWRQMHTFWIKKRIPFTPIHPIFGSLTFLQKTNPSIWLSNIYKEYPFPYVGAWLFWRPGLIINSPDIAYNVLVKDSDIFRNRLIGTGEKDDLGSLNLVTANDPLWSYLRRYLNPTFTPAKVRGWQNLFRSKSDDLIDRIKSDNEKGIVNNLKPLFADYATDIIGESAFGIKCEATKNGSGHLRAMTKEFEKVSTYRALQWSSMFFLPELADMLGFTFWPKHTMVYFKKLFSTIVKNRGGYEKDTDGKKDLMDTLIKMKQDAIKNNKDLDEVIVIANAMVFLQGGYDTSSMLLTYLTYELAYHPQYQEIIHKELLEVKDKTGNDKFEASDLAELPYLNAVIKEIMRKHPIIGWLDRVALQDYQIDKNLTIPTGTAVLINIYGIQNDPKHFQDPKQFKPERFLQENEKEILPYTYMPFGKGPRHCIGKLFGLLSMRYAVAAMIVHFILKPLPNAPVPKDLVYDEKGIFAQPGDIMSVEFIPRS